MYLINILLVYFGLRHPYIRKDQFGYPKRDVKKKDYGFRALFNVNNKAAC
ncbi:Uncharacterised protein [Chryseobacterium carnipullorum]|uniref:Uncharacterized protein n=1 Tax=Chryseobacterium carnipullorum TaxID=1124835 RepID=A0A376EKY2_CHRCU|nr:Uncharacterised protein [Chryseobacterium carnipullorum]